MAKYIFLLLPSRIPRQFLGSATRRTSFLLNLKLPQHDRRRKLTSTKTITLHPLKHVLRVFDKSDIIQYALTSLKVKNITPFLSHSFLNEYQHGCTFDTPNKILQALKHKFSLSSGFCDQVSQFENKRITGKMSTPDFQSNLGDGYLLNVKVRKHCLSLIISIWLSCNSRYYSITNSFPPY